MKRAGWITLFYALIVFLGGVVGFVRVDSSASLVTGIVFGILLSLAAFGMMKDRLLPTYLGVILVLVLDAFFTYRWLLSFQFFPAGLMTLISICVLIALVLLIKSHLKTPKKNR